MSTIPTKARVSIQTADFDVTAELAALRAGDHRVGAVCSFVGTVRTHTATPTPPASLPAPVPGPGLLPGIDSPIVALELEHYPGMTERSIEAMVDAAHARFDIFAARVIHRVGVLQPGAQIVLVAVTSAHRGQSFLACEFLMDYLKTQAPFWKKETTVHGARWVDARAADDAAVARWGIDSGNAKPP